MESVPCVTETHSASFEPQEETALKCLTWKTVFLLGLTSGKRRSEIHTCTMHRLLCLGDWDQVQVSLSQGQNEIHLVNETNVLSCIKLYLSVCNQHIIIQNKLLHSHTIKHYNHTKSQHNHTPQSQSSSHIHIHKYTYIYVIQAQHQYSIQNVNVYSTIIYINQ